ncbi:MAG: TIGR03560 family F420-dependent LLM class oxidoreductase [Anaerolineales bacterium]|jgi:F420-dependent oxidoreductase-like protein
MVQIGIMIEGQNGLNWENWQHIAYAVEDAGYFGLFRSDHFTNSKPPDKDSLELWTSLTWVASHTKRIEFGPLVTPFSFRHPAHTARMAAAVDDLSGGRFSLGLGAGWQEREHNSYGLDLLEPLQRFNRFEEGVGVISKLLRCDVPITYNGEFYRLKDAILLPRPIRPGGPPIIIGGVGEKRTIPIAAKYADEWNALFISLDEFRRLNALLDTRLVEYGRNASEVRRSVMTGCVFGRDTEEVEYKIKNRAGGQKSIEELRNQGMIVGTADEIKEQVDKLGSIGVQRLMLQWLDLDDLQGLAFMAAGIID